MANPNPSPETRFKAGQTPNPLGKTSEQRRHEVESAAIAAKLRHAALSRMMERVEAGELDPIELAKDGFLRLMKDSEDRAHGTPRQTTDITSDGKAVAMPVIIALEGVDVERDDQA